MSKSVNSILNALYEDNVSTAATAHGVGPSAVYNWKAWGCFPRRTVAQLLIDAESKGTNLSVRDIPLQSAAKAAA